MAKAPFVFFVAAGMVITLLIVSFTILTHMRSSITTFEECVRAGYPIITTYPQRCRTPEGLTLVAPVLNRRFPYAGDYYVSVSAGHEKRNAWVHIPPQYDGKRRLPVLIMLHPLYSDPITFMNRTNMNALADREGFIVVYPEGTATVSSFFRSWNAGQCCGTAREKKVDEETFMKALITHLIENYSANPQKIAVVGFSQGGMLSLKLACTMPEYFAAAVSVGGTLALDVCDPSVPPSILIIHGMKDNVVPFEGGLTTLFFESFYAMPIPELLAFWSVKSTCPHTSSNKTTSTLFFQRYGPCEDNVTIEGVYLLRGNHGWPGGEKIYPLLWDEPTKEFNANEYIWAFVVNASNRKEGKH